MTNTTHQLNKEANLATGFVRLRYLCRTCDFATDWHSRKADAEAELFEHLGDDPYTEA